MRDSRQFHSWITQTIRLTLVVSLSLLIMITTANKITVSRLSILFMGNVDSENVTSGHVKFCIAIEFTVQLLQQFLL